MKKFQIIGVDIDETISTAFDWISKKNKKALQKVVALGYTLVFATGRARNHARTLIKKVFDEGQKNVYLIAYNGAYIEKWSDHTVHYLKTFSAQATTWLHELGESFQLTSWSYCQFNYNLGITGYRRNWFTWFLKFINHCQISYFDRHPAIKAFKIEYHGKKNNLQKISEVIKRVYPYCKNYKYRLFSLREHFQEFMPISISKKCAMANLLKHLDLSFQDLLMYGNGNNDIELLQVAKKGIAVSNANKNVKAVANDITGKWYFSGVATSLQKELNFKL